ncbi:MAG: leucine--tRNA ligase [Candidatus Wildermuthbacteria bacterium RIFCSPHIGHO2_01_FULL_48_25]|uniref:Leucine--tRNA ligase n=1 Tax=Candidatus Wildermuthbacteria bacterium RIFCSPLOWO2_01_FULL_48_16 TaxID=1802461 RepID=A0A1G2RKJ0_9BACT|nr:MAG: leucine--tRNA ligase [Candidatus Wildermuthbacteria bacterium RIFCSPHIGHO2_01_FULL_48_25]OHA68172.1 MAG: leucine--tRNA ligase [Candidatus Wildermuthbacteria bacterium RIFCSPHIGHO2_02_FULL_49_12b]OHA73018.1 MAG: leucine--tRNA ligase [Candidatus Wildermuthbacteria bacterium RIFCSPLOWO2_01_FULL_48_16]
MGHCMANYNPQQIEAKWAKAWERKKAWQVDLKKVSAKGRKPYYNLMMFPYPSAEGLHVGNVYAFTGSDIHGRFERMRGNDVFEPMGFDSFGIHSENFAIKMGTHPKAQTAKNIKHFTEQLKQLGALFDWSRAVTTSEPEYYKWTQWLFLQLYKAGLAYKAKAPVDWCPSCKTVLANEQVIDGKCERCSSQVMQKELEQWFFRITKYADKLLKNLEKIDWSERTKIAQRNWIGRSEGAQIEFKIQNSSLKINAFTTRPDTLFGATYMVFAPEHELVEKLKSQIKNWGEVQKYLEEAKQKSELERTELTKEKTGVELKGVRAVNPATKENIPVFIADYVLASYGTGAIMAVPAHDERDLEFATKYKLPITEVVIPWLIDKRNPPVAGKKKVERRNVHAIVRNPKDGKILCLKWKKFNWLTFPMGGVEENEDIVKAARREVEEETGYTNLKLVRVLGGQVCAEYFAAHKDENRVSYTTAVLFDLAGEDRVEVSEEEKERHEALWLEKSQITPQNMTHTETGIWLSRWEGKSGSYLGEGVLINSGKFNGMNSKLAMGEIVKFAKGQKKVNYHLRDWLISRQRYWGPPIPIIYCKKCGTVPVPEKDLPVKLPEVKDFRPTGTGKSPLASVASFMNTKCPKCKGKAERETDVSDTFLDSAWYFFRYPCTEFKNKPFDKARVKKWLPVSMYIGGQEHAVLHLLYTRFITMALKDMGHIAFDEPFKKFRAHGLITKEGAKMSKSKGNVVNPDEYFVKYGADTVRMYLMFLGPFAEGGDWSDKGIVGICRFLSRAFELVTAKTEAKNDLVSLRNKTIKKVTEDLENLRYNTAIASLMEYSNEMKDGGKKDIETLLILLAPFAPYMTEELWSKLGHKDSVHNQPWPKYDVKQVKAERIRFIIQVNGKVRDVMELAADTSEKQATDFALKSRNIRKWVGNSKVKRVVFVPGRLVNIVV